MDDEFGANGTPAEGDEDSAEGLSPTLKGELWSDEDEEDGLHEGVPTPCHKVHFADPQKLSGQALCLCHG